MKFLLFFYVFWCKNHPIWTFLEKVSKMKKESPKTHQNEAFEGPGVAGNESSCMIYLGEPFFKIPETHFLIIFDDF